MKTIEGNTSEPGIAYGYKVLEKTRRLKVIVGGFRPGKSMDVEYQCFMFFKDTLGFNTAVACGILANIYCESSFQYNQKPVMDSNGKYSYGLCQWNGGRYNTGDANHGLIAWCNANNLDYTSLIGQLKFLEYELSKYTSMTTKLKSLSNTAQGAFKAAYIYCETFERPAKVTYFSNAIDYKKSKLKLKMLRPNDPIVKKYSPIYIYDYRGKVAQENYWSKYKKASNSHY